MSVDREKILSLVREGLHIDGAYHKQWFLEEIGKACGIKVEIENRMGVNKGIAP